MTEVQDALAALGLGAHVDVLAPFAGFELALVPDPAGTSQLGGVPDVPADFVWSCHRWPLAEVATWPAWAQDELASARTAGQAYDERDQLVMPLAFLAQLDRGDHRLLCFASLSTTLPDPRFAKRIAAAIRRVAGELHPASPPPTVDAPARALAVRAERTLRCHPPWEIAQLIPQPTRDDLGAVRDAIDPLPIEECVPMPPPGFAAVLRIVDHPELGLHVGDASWLTFCVPTDDLVAGRYDHAVATVFCG